MDTGTHLLLLHRPNCCRVHTGGKVEDSGDFSDFYIPPAAHMTEEQSRQLQQLQDEVGQLANMLQ